MQPDEATVPERPPLDSAAMNATTARGVAEALRKHRTAGVLVVTWNKATQPIVMVAADQIPCWFDQLAADPLS